ncbi:MAG TPA: MipA/OmpV family protein [Burkholderiales bacterium]|nr:MipA/OmpV family protein [Burkholderiales bacterium]
MVLLLALPSLAAAQDDDYMFLGAGGYARPKFEGSGERAVELIPAVRYFAKPWFARTTQGILEGGAQWNLHPGLDGGVQLAYEAGPLDHDPDASIGVHLEADGKIGPAPVNGLVRARQHLKTDRGAQLDARGTVGVYDGHGVLAGIYAQATWATEKFFETYYELHESGLFFVAVGALGTYNLTQRWILFGSLESRRLSDAAARSPIVERRSGVYTSLSLAYRF